MAGRGSSEAIAEMLEFRKRETAEVQTTSLVYSGMRRQSSVRIMKIDRLCVPIIHMRWERSVQGVEVWQLGSMDKRIDVAPTDLAEFRRKRESVPRCPDCNHTTSRDGKCAAYRSYKLCPCSESFHSWISP